MPIPPIPPKPADRRARSLSSTAADYLRELITSGVLQPGEPLAIDEVATRLSISATPVRESLQTLRVEGFVDSIRGKGFAVHPITGNDIRDVFSVYATASGELTARATRTATPEMLRELRALHLEMQAATSREDKVRVEAINHDFHSLIHRSVNAPKLLWIVSLTTKYAPRRFYPAIPGWPAASNDDHGAIVDAMMAGDAEAARRAMAKHVTHAGDLLAQHFDELARRRMSGPSA